MRTYFYKNYVLLLILFTSCGSKLVVYDYSSYNPDCFLHETDYTVDLLNYNFSKKEIKSFIDEENDIDILVFSFKSGTIEYSLERFTFKSSLDTFYYVFHQGFENAKKEIEKTRTINAKELEFLVTVNPSKSYLQHCERYQYHSKGKYFLIKRKGKMIFKYYSSYGNSNKLKVEEAEKIKEYSNILQKLRILVR